MRLLQCVFLILWMTCTFKQSLNKEGGLQRCGGSLGQGECCGNLCMLVISSFNVIHASFFL